MRLAGSFALSMVLGLGLASAASAWNPIAYQSDVYVDSERYNAYQDRAVVETSGETVHRSALQRGRNRVAWGSRRWVDRWERDAQGNRVHVWGWTWRDVHGRPHGELKRKTYHSYVRTPAPRSWGGWNPGPEPARIDPIHEELIDRNAGPEQIDIRHTENVRYKDGPKPAGQK